MKSGRPRESTLPTDEFYVRYKKREDDNRHKLYFSLAGTEFICGIFGEAFRRAGVNPAEVSIRLSSEYRQGEISFSWPSPLSAFFKRVIVEDEHLKYQLKGRKYGWSGSKEWDKFPLADPDLIDNMAELIREVAGKTKSKYMKKKGEEA